MAEERCVHQMIRAYCATCQAPRIAREEKQRQQARRAKGTVSKRLLRVGELNSTTLTFLHDRANMRFVAPPRHVDTLKAQYREACGETLDDRFITVVEDGDEWGVTSTGNKGRIVWYWSAHVNFSATDDEVDRLDVGEAVIRTEKGNARRISSNDLVIALLKYGLRPR